MVKQLSTLRGHRNAVSCLEVVHIRDVASCISADDDGWVIWWNINSRKPIGVWRAHEKTIISIKQIGKHVMTQSKDSLIKFWDLADETLGLRTDFPDAESQFPVPSHHTIPFNSLNFCNVAYSDGELAAPALDNSDNIDIYRLSLEPFDIHKKLTIDTARIFNSSEVSSQVKELGIVMSLIYVGDRLFAGFESGHVLGFDVAADKPTMVYSSDFHKPSPILTMKYRDGVLLVGSARRKLTVHEVEKSSVESKVRTPIEAASAKTNSPSGLSRALGDHKAPILPDTEPEPEFVENPEILEFNLKYSGVQLIACYKQFTITGFWNGMIKAYDRAFQEVFRFENKLPQVANLTTNASSDKPNVENNLKLTAMTTAEPQTSTEVTSHKQRALNRLAITSKPLLVAGFSDGNVIIFDLSDSLGDN